MADLNETQEVRALPETIYAVGGRDANRLVCGNELFVYLCISTFFEYIQYALCNRRLYNIAT